MRILMLALAVTLLFGCGNDKDEPKFGRWEQGQWEQAIWTE